MANLIVEQLLPAITPGVPGASAAQTSGRGQGFVNTEFQNTVVFDNGYIGSSTIVSGSGATVALTSSNNGANILMDRAAGIVFTLPTPSVGLQYNFFVSTSVTSNSYKVITNAGTVFLTGSLINVDTDSGNAVAAWTGDGSTHVAVTMNGTTTGGLLGTWLRFTCISSTLWLVNGVDLGNGTVATPFATS